MLAFSGTRNSLTKISSLLLNSQRQHRALRIQQDVLPYALC